MQVGRNGSSDTTIRSPEKGREGAKRGLRFRKARYIIQAGSSLTSSSDKGAHAIFNNYVSPDEDASRVRW